MRYHKKTLRSCGIAFIAAAAISCWIIACKQETFSLSALPKPDFEIVQGNDPNIVTLVNTTSTPTVAYWRVPAIGAKLSGDSANIHFTFEGTYDIQLITAGQGGIDSITKSVTIAQNDPDACNGTAIGFITGCGTKSWSMNPAAGAYKVGPSGPDDGSWWSSVDDDVSFRSCEFNDTYTFTFDQKGTFVYDNKGDFYADGYMGNNGTDCESDDQFTVAQKPWGSGDFNFSVSEHTGVKGLGQITVSGLGAHIGMQKVTNDGEISTGPVNAITYDILEMKHDPAGYDILKLAIYMPTDYWWTFTLRSN